MQILKLRVLVEAGAVRAVEASYTTDAAGWTVAITYASRRGERRKILERQRGGVSTSTRPRGSFSKSPGACWYDADDLEDDLAALQALGRLP